MDVRLANVSGQGLGAPGSVAALPQIPADSRTILTGIAVNPFLDEGQRMVLSQAVAQVDAGVQTPAVREAVLQQIEGLGTYYRKTSSDTFPRWAVLTALRVYGLNLESKNAAPPVVAQQNEAQVVANVRASLETVARQGGVSLGQALVVAKTVGPVQSAPVVQDVELGESSGGGDERGGRVELVA